MADARDWEPILLALCEDKRVSSDSPSNESDAKPENN